jgi:hypothetical protein
MLRILLCLAIIIYLASEVQVNSESIDGIPSIKSPNELKDHMTKLNQNIDSDQLSESDRVRYQREEMQFRRNLESIRTQYGKMSSEYANGLHALGRVVYLQQKYKDVLTIAKEIVRIHERIDGPEHINTAKSLTNVGSTANRLKDMQECERAMNRALYIFLKHYGEDSKEVSQFYFYPLLFINVIFRLGSSSSRSNAYFPNSFREDEQRNFLRRLYARTVILLFIPLCSKSFCFFLFD